MRGRYGGTIGAVCLAYVALVGAWTMGSRPFATPDEPAHYLRALTIANGHLIGPKAPNTLLLTERAISRVGRSWQEGNSRAVRVPAALSPPGAKCLNGRFDVSGVCTESTYVGNYQPLPYLLPAVAFSVSDRAEAASWLARIGAAIPAVAMLALAFAVLWDGTLWSIVGVAVAVTPMVLFLSSVLNPNGLEVAACIAFLACLLRITRDQPHSRMVWVATVGSGAVAVLSWQLGPLFVLFDLLLFAVVIGRSRLVQYSRPLLTSAVFLLTAVALYLIYALYAGGSHTPVALRHLGDLHAGFDQLRVALVQAIGAFGDFTASLPTPIRYAWWMLIGLLVCGALLVGTDRQRLSLLASVVLGVAFPVVFDALVYRHTGFGLQGRYVLPVLVMTPLVAGEILRSRSDAVRTLPMLLPAAVIGLIAILQLAAWWSNARVAAGRPRAVWFASHAPWSPPAGWWPWIAAAAVGSALMMVGAAIGLRPRAAGLASSGV